MATILKKNDETVVNDLLRVVQFFIYLLALHVFYGCVTLWLFTDSLLACANNSAPQLCSEYYPVTIWICLGFIFFKASPILCLLNFFCSLPHDYAAIWSNHRKKIKKLLIQIFYFFRAWTALSWFFSVVVNQSNKFYFVCIYFFSMTVINDYGKGKKIFMMHKSSQKRAHPRKFYLHLFCSDYARKWIRN